MTSLLVLNFIIFLKFYVLLIPENYLSNHDQPLWESKTAVEAPINDPTILQKWEKMYNNNMIYKQFFFYTELLSRLLHSKSFLKVRIFLNCNFWYFFRTLCNQTKSNTQLWEMEANDKQVTQLIRSATLVYFCKQKCAISIKRKSKCQNIFIPSLWLVFSPRFY